MSQTKKLPRTAFLPRPDTFDPGLSPLNRVAAMDFESHGGHHKLAELIKNYEYKPKPR